MPRSYNGYSHGTPQSRNEQALAALRHQRAMAQIGIMVVQPQQHIVYHDTITRRQFMPNHPQGIVPFQQYGNYTLQNVGAIGYTQPMARYAGPHHELAQAQASQTLNMQWDPTQSPMVANHQQPLNYLPLAYLPQPQPRLSAVANPGRKEKTKRVSAKLKAADDAAAETARQAAIVEAAREAAKGQKVNGWVGDALSNTDPSGRTEPQDAVVNQGSEPSPLGHDEGAGMPTLASENEASFTNAFEQQSFDQGVHAPSMPLQEGTDVDFDERMAQQLHRGMYSFAQPHRGGARLRGNSSQTGRGDTNTSTLPQDPEQSFKTRDRGNTAGDAEMTWNGRVVRYYGGRCWLAAESIQPPSMLPQQSVFGVVGVAEV